MFSVLTSVSDCDVMTLIAAAVYSYLLIYLNYISFIGMVEVRVHLKLVIINIRVTIASDLCLMDEYLIFGALNCMDV
jgi:hypothetical protein